MCSWHELTAPYGKRSILLGTSGHRESMWNRSDGPGFTSGRIRFRRAYVSLTAGIRKFFGFFKSLQLYNTWNWIRWSLTSFNIYGNLTALDVYAWLTSDLTDTLWNLTNFRKKFTTGMNSSKPKLCAAGGPTSHSCLTKRTTWWK